VQWPPHFWLHMHCWLWHRHSQVASPLQLLTHLVCADVQVAHRLVGAPPVVPPPPLLQMSPAMHFWHTPAGMQ
jgi:hypothetical protein